MKNLNNILSLNLSSYGYEGYEGYEGGYDYDRSLVGFSYPKRISS